MKNRFGGKRNLTNALGDENTSRFPSGYVGEVKERKILWKNDIAKFSLILTR